MKRRFFLIAAVVLAGGALWIAFDLLSPYRGYKGNLLLVIEPGSRATELADRLVTRGVLRHRLPFLIRYWATRRRRALRAGEYLFDRPLRPIDVCRKLIVGDVYLHTVLIPEGSDRFDIARILNQRMGIDPEEFLRTTVQTMAIHDLDPAAPSLEGYLFPDTYRFPRGVSAATVVTTMLARFRHILATRLASQGPSTTPVSPPQPVGRGSAPDSPLQSSEGAGKGEERSWHEIITLASIVEKETPEASERPLVAGVFERRLEKGMPLQSDPTVVYAARLDHRPSGPITQSELQSDSPFNTYRRAGLPPGPISNPGQASIEAALHPAEGEALYFVANNRGGHVFARTLEEHQHNVSRYRRELAAMRRSEAATAGNDPKPQASVTPPSSTGQAVSKPGATATERAAPKLKRGRNTQ